MIYVAWMLVSCAAIAGGVFLLVRGYACATCFLFVLPLLMAPSVKREIS